jgi:hypothetical protein
VATWEPVEHLNAPAALAAYNAECTARKASTWDSQGGEDLQVEPLQVGLADAAAEEELKATMQLLQPLQPTDKHSDELRTAVQVNR